MFVAIVVLEDSAAMKTTNMAAEFVFVTGKKKKGKPFSVSLTTAASSSSSSSSSSSLPSESTSISITQEKTSVKNTKDVKPEEEATTNTVPLTEGSFKQPTRKEATIIENEGSKEQSFRYASKKISTRNRSLFTPAKMTELLDQIAAARKIINEDKKFCDFFELVQSQTEPVECVCYGLGSVTNSPVSRMQFAFLLNLWTFLEKKKEVLLLAYDPTFTDEDRNILQTFDCRIIEKNEKCQRHVSSSTIFYMPHCGRSMYNNILWSNWLQLNALFIVGNPFSQLTEFIKPTQFSYLQQASQICIESLLPAEHLKGHMFNAFQSTAFHVFQHKNQLDQELDLSEPLHDISDQELIV